MSKILALAETENNAVAVRGSTLDPFEAYANAVAPKNILGSLMKFSKGDYLAGEEGKAIETGTTVTANLDELLAGWIKWKDWSLSSNVWCALLTVSRRRAAMISAMKIPPAGSSTTMARRKIAGSSPTTCR